MERSDAGFLDVPEYMIEAPRTCGHVHYSTQSPLRRDSLNETAPASVTPFVAGLPTAALTPLESTKSIHRHKFTGINKADFVKSWPRTPGTC
jgi:hypothetical protein